MEVFYQINGGKVMTETQERPRLTCKSDVPVARRASRDWEGAVVGLVRYNRHHLPEIERARPMSDDTPETPELSEKFDFAAFPADALIHERRHVADRRVDPEAEDGPAAPRDAAGAKPVEKERRVRRERRRRIDPTTFEKQYTEDELEFMNAMQKLKIQECKSFPTYGDVLRVARGLGYRKGGSSTGADEPGPGEAGPFDRG
jgi:hypothetical protein